MANGIGEYRGIPVVNGDIFESGADIIAHQVNCQGVMNSGVARQVRERYPNVYNKYAEECKKSNPLGKILIVCADNADNSKPLIANLFAQDKYGYDGGCYRVFGVYMPNNYHYVGNVDKDWLDVVALVGHLNIKCKCISIQDAYNDIIKNVSAEPIKLPAVYRNLERLDTKIEVSEQTRINLAPRIRMSVLYAVAQSMNGRVANTCNLSEDWVGYSTRYGDSVGDFSPLSMLTTDEVIEIGLACGLPEELVRKTPSDGLCGKTDEDNLGFTYSTLNEYIRWGTCEDKKIKELIDEKHKKNMFKLRPMPMFDYPHD